MADMGIGEAALLGAAMGGGSSALQGGDPLKGALVGGLMGGAGGAMFGGAPAAEAAVPTASAGAVTPTSFAAAPLDMTAYAPTPTQFGAFGEAPGSVLNGSQTFDAFGGSAPVTATAPVTDAAQQAASQAMGTSQIPNAVTPPTTPGGQSMGDWWNGLSTKQQILAGGAGIAGLGMLADRNKYGVPGQQPYTGPLSKFHYNPATYRPSLAPGYADGGITSLSDQPQQGFFPQSQMDKTQFATPTQMPVSREVLGADFDSQISPYTGDLPRFAHGGIASLGHYSDGGQMLKGPGDGMSDSIPATIQNKQPARLATDEFVVPADVVSHLGNGSSDAGAKQLYKMMDKVRKARTGTTKQGRQIHAEKYLPKMADGGSVDGYAEGGIAHFDLGGMSKLADNVTNQDKNTQAAAATAAAPTTYGTQKFSASDINNFIQQHINDPQAIAAAANKYNISADDIASAGVYKPEQIQDYFSKANLTIPGFQTQYTQMNRPSSQAPQQYGDIYRPTYDQQTPANYNMNANLGAWNNTAPQQPALGQGIGGGFGAPQMPPIGQGMGGFGQAYGAYAGQQPVYGAGQASMSGDLAGGALSGLGGQNMGIAANPYAQNTGGIQAQVLPTFAKGGIAALMGA